MRLYTDIDPLTIILFSIVLSLFTFHIYTIYGPFLNSFTFKPSLCLHNMRAIYENNVI